MARSIPLAGPLTLFLLGGLLGMFASYDRAVSVTWLLWLAAGVTLYIVVSILARRPRPLRWCARILALVAAGCGLMLLTQYQYLHFENKFGAIARVGMFTSALFPRFVAADFNPNALADLLAILFPLTVALIVTTRGGLRLFWCVALALVSGGLLLTASRGAWLAVAVAAAVAGLAWLRARWHASGARLWPGGASSTPEQRRTYVRRGLAVLGITAVILALIFADGLGNVAHAFAMRATDRMILYRNSFFLALNFPFTGIGPGATFGDVYSRFALLILVPFVGYAHNLLLGIWLAQGMLGLIGFCALVLGGSREIVRRLRDQSDPNLLLRWGAALGCLVALVHGMTDAPQYDTAWTITLSLYAILALAVAPRPGEQPLQWVRLTSARGLVVAGATVAVLVFSWPTLLALANANIAAILQARSLLAPGLDDAQRTAVRHEAEVWATQALQYSNDSPVAQKRRGILALADDDPALAVPLLERAVAQFPADQSVIKALGYSYIWDGQIDKGAQQLLRLDRATEAREELDIWTTVWESRGRFEFATRAQAAAHAMDAAARSVAVGSR